MLDPRDSGPETSRHALAILASTTYPSVDSVAAVVGRGIHDPMIWGRDFQVPRRLRDAIAQPAAEVVAGADGDFAG